MNSLDTKIFIFTPVKFLIRAEKIIIIIIFVLLINSIIIITIIVYTACLGLKWAIY